MDNFFLLVVSALFAALFDLFILSSFAKESPPQKKGELIDDAVCSCY